MNPMDVVKGYTNADGDMVAVPQGDDYTHWQYKNKFGSDADYAGVNGWGFDNWYEDNRDFIYQNPDMDYVYSKYKDALAPRRKQYDWNNYIKGVRMSD